MVSKFMYNTISLDLVGSYSTSMTLYVCDVRLVDVISLV